MGRENLTNENNRKIFWDYIYWDYIGVIGTLIIFILFIDGYCFPKTFNQGWVFAYQTLLAGFLALGGGAFALIAVKKQIKASIKEKWLHEFRNDIASFLSETSAMNDVFKQAVDCHKQMNKLNIEIERLTALRQVTPQLEKDLENTKRKEEKYHSDFKEKSEKSGLYNIKVQLFLNKNIPAHKKLNELLKKWAVLSIKWGKYLLQDQKESTEVFKEAQEIKKKIVQSAQSVCDYEINHI